MAHRRHAGPALLALAGLLLPGTTWARQNIAIGEITIGYDYQERNYAPAELADYLKKLYATVYSDPVITAVLMQSNSRRYTVMGQVTQPGVFPLDYPITIVQSIARSGGCCSA